MRSYTFFPKKEERRREIPGVKLCCEEPYSLSIYRLKMKGTHAVNDACTSNRNKGLDSYQYKKSKGQDQP